jgi:hypothetical protein
MNDMIHPLLARAPGRGRSKTLLALFLESDIVTVIYMHPRVPNVLEFDTLFVYYMRNAANPEVGANIKAKNI